MTEQAAQIMTDSHYARSVIRVGLIGAGIGASRTPRMHMSAAQALGLDLDYALIDSDLVDGAPKIDALLDHAEGLGFAGVNVTFPFKRSALDHVDNIAPSAAAVGATNAIVFKNGQRTAHNTDYSGFAEAFLRSAARLPHATALLLGAGGAGRAVAHALLDSGVRVLFVHDVVPTAMHALADDLAQRVGADRIRVVHDLRVATAASDGIINATPVGMAKLPGTPLDPALVEPRHWVCDIVYFPLETALLAAAKAKGCDVIDGSGMAVFQAVAAFELFTGLAPDPAQMRETFDSFT